MMFWKPIVVGLFAYQTRCQLAASRLPEGISCCSMVVVRMLISWWLLATTTSSVLFVCMKKEKNAAGMFNVL
jgi:hypothetical protein